MKALLLVSILFFISGSGHAGSTGGGGVRKPREGQSSSAPVCTVKPVADKKCSLLPLNK